MNQDKFPRGKTAIVSAATYGLGESPGLSSMDLAVSASVRALQQAGLTPGDVDGLFIALPDDALSGLGFAEYLGIQPRITENNRTGGSSFLTHALWAALAIEAGQCDLALIAYGSNQRTATGRLISSLRPSAYESPCQLVRPVGAYALAASRYMHEYGLRREQLGQVAIAARRWAQLNPDAFLRTPLSMQEYLASRMVSDPLSVRDCCLVTDGAAAVVMASAQRAGDLARRPVYLLGAAAATDHKDITAMPDLTTTAAVHSGARAFAQSGYKPGDMDVAELYDAFTINTLLFLEDLGFCNKGEAGAFVEGGRIAPGGALPVNTNGGGLSCTHPGMYGLFTMVEATQQLMGQAGERQVKNAQLAVAHGNGGELSSQVTLVLGTEDTL
ncbi:thiolase [Verminephrobacter eiseniae]|uniref:Thiolase n=1 Tax=Verminephrobacter eiseniae (strain EF01-2) TaxID=391735 RepID=A1WL19_VEREI|nr:thiolase [Verminephrobacter eiseniae]ABM58326.1 thiolase [Verminephrobacter eiseniae EF01-2]MCW5263098.1 thiolase [Verminephrobacter eiseniae]MCW5283910.1 thiolase [Verminephrobacter eiseniae]MCW5301619.1 thiolase [Verminephrobacter eiseniae]MCW8182138.1 thiolase [Verminephrobacter eiseniae]